MSASVSATVVPPSSSAASRQGRWLVDTARLGPWRRLFSANVRVPSSTWAKLRSSLIPSILANAGRRRSSSTSTVRKSDWRCKLIARFSAMVLLPQAAVGEVIANLRQPLSRICCNARVRIMSTPTASCPPCRATMRLRFISLGLILISGKAFHVASTEAETGRDVGPCCGVSCIDALSGRDRSIASVGLGLGASATVPSTVCPSVWASRSARALASAD